MCRQARNSIINLEVEARDKLLKKAIPIFQNEKETLLSLFTKCGEKKL